MAVVYGDTTDNPAAYTENASPNTYTEKMQEKTESLNVHDLLSGTGGTGVGDRFITDIYGEERQTPHNEMQSVRDMLLRNAFVNTAVDTVSDLLLGDEVRIKSSDSETENWFNNAWLPGSNALEAMSVTAADFIAYGNYYVEKRQGVVTNIPRKFEAVAHPERVWKQIEDNKVTGYVLEVPRSQVNTVDGVKRFKVGYGGSVQRSVPGVRFDSGTIVSGRMGQGDYRFYGRSPLASTISDHKILREIERSMAVFSRYKSVPKKLISAFDQTGENPLNPSSFNDLDRDWKSLNDFENLLVNGKKFDVNDLDYSGNQVDFTVMTDYFKRKITSALIPGYYLHGETTTYAVSNSQESTFMLRMQSWRNQFLSGWNEILQGIARKKGLSLDVEWDLGSYRVETQKEKEEKAVKAFNAGSITVDEMRGLMGLPPADDEVVGRSYQWELKQDAGLGPMLQQKLEDMADVDGV